MTLQPTVSWSWVQTVLAEARRQGVDEGRLLEVCGVCKAECQGDRWPVDQITRLWRAAADLTHDRSFGLHVGAAVGPTSFNVVSFILQSCANLREAVAVVQKYQRLVSDGGRFQLLGGQATSWLIYHPCQGELAFSAHQIEAVLAAVVSFSQRVAQSDRPPDRVRFTHGRVGAQQTYRETFACAVEFDQAFNGLEIANEVLDRQLPQADAQLARLHDAYAASRLRQLSDERDLPQTLRAWVQAHFGPPLPTRARAALAFGMTDKTFARRLQSLDMRFSDLVDDIRRERALAQLDDPHCTIAQVALDLGFADVSPFYRAFERWTGRTPAKWRQRLR